MWFDWWFLLWLIPAVVVPIAFTFMLRKRTAQLMQPLAYPAMMPAPGMMPPPQPVAPPAPTHIKKTPCRNCGAVKVQPPKTACLYCDFCGTLVDWDLRMAMAAGFTQPLQELGRLTFMEKPTRDQALAMGNREAYRQSVMRVWDQHIARCPSFYSPRIGDPSYRQALLHYLGIVDTEIAFDPESRRLEQVLVGAVRMMPRQPGVPVHPQTLQQLVAMKKASLDRAMTLLAPHLHLHPDESTSELARAVMASTFVQKWLPFLNPAQQEWLIGEMGLGGDYAPITPVEATERHCGNCGGTVMCVDGARRILCEYCGFFSDMTRPELTCPECRGQASAPVGTHHFSCPYCKADMRVG